MPDEAAHNSADDEDARLLVQIFALLVKGFAALAARDVSPLTARFRSVLEGFRELSARLSASSLKEAVAHREVFASLIRAYAAAVEAHRRSQEICADDFKLLEVMNLTGKEIRHSMALAWLLDHDIRRLGTHAQGSLGFRLFLSKLGLPEKFASDSYLVRREVLGDNSIVDIEIAARNRFLIHIENKIWASEGRDQTKREWEDLKRRAYDLGLDAERQDAPVYALFLTPSGAPPACNRFRPISWATIVRILEEFSERAKPADVKLFSAHYARALRRFIVTQPISSGGENG